MPEKFGGDMPPQEHKKVKNPKEQRERIKIIVVEKKVLFGDNHFKGFRLANEIDYLSRILKDFKWMERAVVEDNPKYKQPIAYSAIVNPTRKQVFIYQRASQDTRYQERRLQGKWSCGIGGHIEKSDIKPGNIIQISALRELQEEVNITGPVKIKMLGYINDDSDKVGKVHFGIFYIVETDSEVIKPKDSEIENGRLRTFEELDKIYFSPDYTIEGWSRIIFEPLKSYLMIAGK